MTAAINSSGVKISKVFFLFPGLADKFQRSELTNCKRVLEPARSGFRLQTSALRLLHTAVSGYLIPGMHAESFLMPGHEHLGWIEAI